MSFQQKQRIRPIFLYRYQNKQSWMPLISYLFPGKTSKRSQNSDNHDFKLLLIITKKEFRKGQSIREPVFDKKEDSILNCPTTQDQMLFKVGFAG